MPDSYPFPVYSGVLEPIHYKQINSAIWLFLWCISSTTKEEERDGQRWGIVLGGSPIEIDNVADRFGVNRSTVKRWIKTLEEHDYIRTRRAPYGLIFSVRKSKKFDGKAKNESSPFSDGSNVSYPDGANMNLLDGRDGANLSHQGGKNEPSNKDIIDFITTTADPFEALLDAYCTLHGKLDIHVKRTDITLMQWMVNRIPVELIIRVMREIHQERIASGTSINGFSYYKQAIIDAWNAAKAITDGVPASAVALGDDSITDRVPVPSVALGSPRRNKQQQTFDLLDQIAQEGP